MAPKYLESRVPVSPRATQATVSLTPGAGSIRGFVETSWGEPLGEALVFLEEPQRVVRTTRQGMFQILRLPYPAELAVFAVADGFEMVSQRLPVVTATDQAVVPSIKLASLFRVVGTIHDAAHRPVVAATVSLAAFPEPPITASSDDSGRFLIPLPHSGRFTVRVSHGDLASEVDISATEKQPVADAGVITLSRTRAVWGLVRDSAGVGVEGVAVVETGSGFAARDASGKPTGGFLAETNSSGLFEAEVAAGKAQSTRLEFWKDGYAPAMVEHALGSDEAILVDLVPSYRVTGSVRDERGQPIVGARITWSSAEDFPRSGSQPLATTDRRGRFEFGGIASDSFEVAVAAAGFTVERRQFERDRHRQDTSVEITLRAEARLRLRVKDTRGTPIVGAVVGVADLRLPLGGWIDTTDAQVGKLTTVSAPPNLAGWIDTTDAEGRVELFALPSGVVRLSIRLQGSRDPIYRDALLLAGTQDLELTVSQ